MKVLFRMLASILPGVIVGLGVIAYLEREALQEQWLLYSSGKGHHEEVEPVSAVAPSGWPTPATSARQIEVPERFGTARPEPQEPTLEAAAVQPPAAQSRPPQESVPPLQQPAVAQSQQPAPRTVVEAEPARSRKTGVEGGQAAVRPQQDLAAVVGLRPQQRQPSQSQPSQLSQRPRQAVTGAPVEPPLSSFPESQPEPQSQPAVSELLADPLPAAVAEIASLSKPMESLARQFNPLSGLQQPGGGEKGATEGDVWALSMPVEESQHQWLWNRGRQAFWEGDYEQAVESYRSLLEEDGNNPDAWGELGNIYYANKDWVRAVRAFGRAAAVLIEMRRVDEAKKIIQVIRTIDPALAQQLEEGLG